MFDNKHPKCIQIHIKINNLYMAFHLSSARHNSSTLNKKRLNCSKSFTSKKIIKNLLFPEAIARFAKPKIRHIPNDLIGVLDPFLRPVQLPRIQHRKRHVLRLQCQTLGVPWPNWAWKWWWWWWWQLSYALKTTNNIYTYTYIKFTKISSERWVTINKFFKLGRHI